MANHKLFFHNDGKWVDYENTDTSFQETVDAWWTQSCENDGACGCTETMLFAFAEALGVSAMYYNEGDEVGLKTCEPAPGALMQIHKCKVDDHEFIKTCSYGAELGVDYVPALGHLLDQLQ